MAGRRIIGAAVAAALCWAVAPAVSAGAATTAFTVSFAWQDPTPACVDTVVCSGVGTPAFAYGTPADEASSQTSLTISARTGTIRATGWATVGTLEYCNGATFSDSVVDSVDLATSFAVVGGPAGATTDTTLLVNTENGEDPLASADVLSLASRPGTQLHVLEGACVTVALRGLVSSTPEPGIDVAIGEVTTPGSGFVSVDGVRRVGLCIKPGQERCRAGGVGSGEPAPLNPGARGVVPVAVLGSALTDAAALDTSSFRLEGAPAVRAQVTDVDGDGTADVLFHVRTQSMTTLDGADVEACATVATLSGEQLGACTPVRVL